MLNNLQQMRLKLLQKKSIQKTGETASSFISNKIADRITKISKNSLENNSETVTNKHDKEIPKARYISPEERYNIADDLRLI